jgi:hypothetical protein
VILVEPSRDYCYQNQLSRSSKLFIVDLQLQCMLLFQVCSNYVVNDDPFAFVVSSESGLLKVFYLQDAEF